MQRLYPSPVETLDADDLTAAYSVPQSGSWRHPWWLRANFVQTLDGATVAADGRSKALGTDADRLVFRLARSLADVVLVGAGTVRAEDYAPSTQPVAIVTRSLNLPADLRLFAERQPKHTAPILLTTSTAAAATPPWIADTCTIVTCGTESVDLPTALRALSERGLTRILCEGGASLLTDILAVGLLDELIVTVVPQLLGATSANHLSVWPGGLHPVPRMKLRHVLEQEGTLLTRWVREP